MGLHQFGLQHTHSVSVNACFISINQQTPRLDSHIIHHDVFFANDISAIPFRVRHTINNYCSIAFAVFHSEKLHTQKITL